MIINRYYLFIFLISSSLFSYCQLTDSSGAPQLAGNYYSKVEKKIHALDERLLKKSVKYLEKFQRQEQHLQQTLEKSGTANAGDIFNNSAKKYKELLKQIKSGNTKQEEGMDGPYNPYLDSLGTSLSFLQQFENARDKVKEPLATLNKLQSRLQQSEKITAFIAERKSRLKELLSGYTKIPGSLKKGFDKLNKTAYYYAAQMKEYKDLLNDPKKAEQKALHILTRLPVFEKFMKQNGQLAALFHINENSGPVESLAGLQTITSVQEMIQQKITTGGPNATQFMQQNIAQAKSEFDKLKEKASQFGGAASDIDIPGFIPNNEKTKSFLKRLEYSATTQFAKTTSLLPSATDIGLGIGYKLNDKSSLGIGLSYKMGMGTLRNIAITSQGLGLKAYGDWKIKKQFYASFGYEMNYNAVFKNIEQLKNYRAWQRSALAGISKRYRISKKVKGEIKLLYDFLANRHIPVTDAFLFRMGYKF